MLTQPEQGEVMQADHLPIHYVRDPILTAVALGAPVVGSFFGSEGSTVRLIATGVAVVAAGVLMKDIYDDMQTDVSLTLKPDQSE